MAEQATAIGRGNDEFPVEQRMALLCSLYRVSRSNMDDGDDFCILSDPNFLKENFKDLSVENELQKQYEKQQEKAVRFAILWNCNKILPEVHALGRNVGVAELEEKFGKFQVWNDAAAAVPAAAAAAAAAADDDDDDEEEEDDDDDCPYAIYNIVQKCHDAEHFLLTEDQWAQLFYQSYWHCDNQFHMSVLTFKNKDVMDVKDIFDPIEIL